MIRRVDLLHNEPLERRQHISNTAHHQDEGWAAMLSAGTAPHHHQAGHAADRAKEWLSWARTWSTGELCTLAERADQTLQPPADANCGT